MAARPDEFTVKYCKDLKGVLISVRDLFDSTMQTRDILFFCIVLKFKERWYSISCSGK